MSKGFKKDIQVQGRLFSAFCSRTSDMKRISVGVTGLGIQFAHITLKFFDSGNLYWIGSNYDGFYTVLSGSNYNLKVFGKEITEPLSFIGNIDDEKEFLLVLMGLTVSEVKVLRVINEIIEEVDFL